jgi:hypothetical protein
VSQREGLRKIVKKHDKNTGIDMMSEWRPLIERSDFHASAKLLEVTTDIGLQGVLSPLAFISSILLCLIHRH